MRNVLSGIHSWSVFNEARGIDFNGFFVQAPAGNVLIDPPTLRPEDEEEIERLGLPGAILLTNKDHVRMARECRDRFGAQIGISALDAPLIEFRPDFTFKDGDALPGSFVAVHVPGNKSPGETALLHPEGGGTLILGDALIGKPSGDLTLLPPEKYADPARARAGLRRLLEYPFRSILIGDGPLVPLRERAALERFLQHG